MLKHIGIIFITALVLMMLSQCKAATIEEILRVDWNKQSLPELKRLIPDQEAAQKFATAVLLEQFICKLWLSTSFLI
jgi:hypothetical protein